jgi:hypothetical protein
MGPDKQASGNGAREWFVVMVSAQKVVTTIHLSM